MAAQLEHMQIAPYDRFDGEILAREKVTVDPFAHGLHHGTGVSEGIRAYATPDGAAFDAAVRGADPRHPQWATFAKKRGTVPAPALYARPRHVAKEAEDARACVVSSSRC